MLFATSSMSGPNFLMMGTSDNSIFLLSKDFQFLHYSGSSYSKIWPLTLVNRCGLFYKSNSYIGLYLLIDGMFRREDLDRTFATSLAMLFFSATWSTDIFAAKLRAILKIINNNLDYFSLRNLSQCLLNQISKIREEIPCLHSRMKP